MFEKVAAISFIVPAYNEESGIAETLRELTCVLESLECPFEVIVVNDGSKDATAQIAEKIDGVKVVSHPINIGYGNALKTGISLAQYQWVGMIDADGTYPVDVIPDMVEELNKGFDMVIAQRMNTSEFDSIPKRFFRKVYKQAVGLLTGSKSLDPNSGLRVMRKAVVLEFYDFLCGTFSFTTGLTILASEKPFFVKYLPIQYKDRKGTSKVRHFRDSLRTIQLVVQGITYYNPIKFFILLALAMIFLVGFPAMCIAMFRAFTLSAYYMIFGSTVALLFGLGVLGDIIRVSAAKSQRSSNGVDRK